MITNMRVCAFNYADAAGSFPKRGDPCGQRSACTDVPPSCKTSITFPAGYDCVELDEYTLGWLFSGLPESH